MRTLPLVFLLGLIACSSTPPDSSSNSSYVGKSYDEIVRMFGNPTKSYDLVGDTRLIQYITSDTFTNSSGAQKQQSCTARFWLSDEHVKQVTYDGDDHVCKQFRKNARAF